MTNLLQNPMMEGDTWRRTHIGVEFGEIVVPKPWVAAWSQAKSVPHDPRNTDGYGRPEMHVIAKQPPFLDPPRIHEGQNALKYFTFWRIHDAGIYQQVQGVEPGRPLRLTAWAHAWSSQQDNPHVSDGAGSGPFFKLEGSTTDSNERNFIFTVGIDPTGGTDPWGSTVVWGQGAHIYNVFAQVPEVEVLAQGSTVTVFLRTQVLWPFKHCDAYWDKIELIAGENGDGPVTLTVEPVTVRQGQPFEVLVSPASGVSAMRLEFAGGEVLQGPVRVVNNAARYRCVALTGGAHKVRLFSAATQLTEEDFTVVAQPVFVPPREDYARTYVLLPPGAGVEWVQAILESGAWARYRWTIGGSADDAGAGPTQRKVLAINPQGWSSNLEAFFNQYYPGLVYQPIQAATPVDLKQILSGM